MSGSYLSYLCGVAVLCLSCNPGNYDLMSCDPTVKTLSMDICNTLNTQNTNCKSMYQCDAATTSCKLSPRDFDRDGDPDIACGGTDCNDFDPGVNGVNKLCGCGTSIGQPCTVGTGACKTDRTYSCNAGSLYCGLTPSPPVPNPGYMAKAYDNGSFDWDCDGKVDMKCPDGTGALMDCTGGSCAGTAFSADLTSDQVASACTSYCKAQATAACKQSAVFICDKNCGRPVHYCNCEVTGLVITACTPVSPQPPSSTVRCK